MSDNTHKGEDIEANSRRQQPEECALRLRVFMISVSHQQIRAHTVGIEIPETLMPLPKAGPFRISPDIITD